MSEDMDKTLDELDKKVNEFVKPTTSSLMAIPQTISKNWLNFDSKIVVYAIAPTILFILFMFTKPSFVMKNVVVQGTVVDSKLDISKVIGFTVFLSIIIDYFIYKHKPI
jgi:hypothetical protein